jgi:tetratricopeptide (TPR) repeat protein
VSVVSGHSATQLQSSGPGQAASPDPLDVGRVVDRYVVLNRIGKGGMGVVYAAYDPQLDRKVAIKILRPDVASDAPGQRLLREAQAMARVSHPNVMRVYDVGTVDDVIFMAMELVEGETLGDRLITNRPLWRECLRLFIAAGRGLAAAHAAGLVHRDFKPANVLVGQDGAVKVTDFGLARADNEGGVVELPAEIREQTGPTALDAQLTRAGAFMGTPMYMSPEQLNGQRADARSDQFSFCVAAYQALYGDWPFSVTTIEALKAATAKGQIGEAPRGTRVPTWVRRALVRGLSASPEQRWPTMEALLSELERDPGVKLRQRVGGAVALGLVAVAAASGPLLRARAREDCARAGTGIARSWTADQKAQVHRAFTATGAPFAEDVWATSERRLDSYTAAWSAMRTEACEAAMVKGTQTREQLALRVGCLDQRQKELDTLVDVLSRADAQVVRGAVGAVHALSSIESCSDVIALHSTRPPPSDPASRGKIEEARTTLAAAKSLTDFGDVAPALVKAREAEVQAQATGFAPLIAETLIREGELQGKTGDRKSAEATLQRAVAFAETADADELAARAWNQLCFVVGYELGRNTEGEAFCGYARAILARDGANPELQGDNLRFTGLVLENEGKYDDALEVLKKALAVNEKLYGSEHPAVATVTSSVGNAYILMAQYAMALPFHERALAIRLKLLGPQHPDTSSSYHNLAICLLHLGDRDRAIGYLEKALAVDTAVYGPHADHTALTRHTLAKAWLSAHQPEKAREAASQALSDMSQAFGPDSPATCPARQVLGSIALSQGDAATALEHFQKGLVLREKQKGADHAVLGEYLAGIGECQLMLHRPQLALQAFERATHLNNVDREPPEVHAAVAWGLARAIWETKGDKASAIEHAREAQRLFAQAYTLPDEAPLVDAWLDTHTR